MPSSVCTQRSLLDELRTTTVTIERCLEIARQPVDHGYAETIEMIAVIEDGVPFEQLVAAYAAHHPYRRTPHLMKRVLERAFYAAPSQTLRTVMDILAPHQSDALSEILNIFAQAGTTYNMRDLLHTSLPGELTAAQHLVLFTPSRKIPGLPFAVLWDRRDYLAREICEQPHLTPQQRSTATVLAENWEGTLASLTTTARALSRLHRTLTPTRRRALVCRIRSTGSPTAHTVA
jgi:hypothetical protein